MKNICKRDKKGFTLVEIIICIALIALIATISIISLSNNKKDEDTKKEEKEVENAVDILISDKISDNTWKSYEKIDETNLNNTQQISCLDPDTLVKKGYITEDNSYYNYLISNNLYLKVTILDVGTTSYEEVDKNSSDCFTYEDNTVFTPAEEVPTVSGEGYEFKQIIEADENSGNTYKYTLSYKFNLKTISDISVDIPLYAIVVLDESGSMSGTRWRNAKTAVETLSDKIVTIGKKNQVALVKFGTNYNISRTFSHSKILASSITFDSSGNTCYSCGLEGAYNLLNSSSFNISKKKSENSNFFVVFLSDGGDNYKTGSRTTNLQKVKDLITDDYGKVITIGYAYNSSTLSKMASNGCGTSLSDGRCYYEGDTSSIVKLFDSLASTMVQTASCSKLKKADVIVYLSDNFKNKTNNSNKIEFLDIAMDCDESTLDLNSIFQTLDNEIIYTPSTTACSENQDVCEVTENIIKDKKDVQKFSTEYGVHIKFYDKKNKPINEESKIIESSEFPTVTLKLNKYSVVN